MNFESFLIQVGGFLVRCLYDLFFVLFFIENVIYKRGVIIIYLKSFVFGVILCKNK